MDLSQEDALTAEIAEAKAKAAEMIGADPVAAYDDNPGQVRFFGLIKDPCPTITIAEFLKGNGSGGSWALVKAWSAIMFGTAHPLFQGAPFGKEWPFPHRSARLVTTSEALKDTGPIQFAMRMLFPVGRWSQTRGAGKQYYSEGKTDTGWTWDCMTYNQAVLEFASANKDLILLSEPPPEGIFQEAVTRLRGRGLVLVDMTQLDMAQFNQKLLEDGLTINGKKVGDVRHTYMHHHEACADHFPGGHRTHESIEAEYALWLREDPAIADARASGKSLRLSGLIYPTWGDANELAELPEYHAACWDKGRVRLSTIADPHDRKPWAMAWFATFPNSDVIGFAEWPPFKFSEVKASPISDIDDYRAAIMDLEKEIGVPINGRGLDPRFGAAPKSGTGESVQAMLAGACRRCKDRHKEKALELCKHRLHYDLAPYESIHHAPLRGLIGNAEKGIRPKFYVLKDFCPNLAYGMRHYAWKENKDPKKGLSETAELVHKDFPDLPRYLVDLGWHIYPPDVVNVDLRTKTSTARPRS